MPDDKFFTSLLASLAAGTFLTWATSRLRIRIYSTSDFVNPAAVEDIATSLVARTEDEFIMAAWRFVSDNIEYEGKASDLHFVGDTIKCAGCYLPLVTLNKGFGNCVAMSSLLTSILRNRIPAERVLMSVGDIKFDGVGGHAWVQVQRQDDNWYILEATRPPGGWARVETLESYYIPMSLMNDRYFNCFSDRICKVPIGNCEEAVCQ